MPTESQFAKFNACQTFQIYSIHDILCHFRSGQMYYMFGFIMLAFLVLVIVCAQTSVLLCYFHLCSEDYRWWWRSFFSTGTTAFYLFLFSIHYFVYKTSITGTLSYLLYFGYTSIMVFLFFVMTGNFTVCMEIMSLEVTSFSVAVAV